MTYAKELENAWGDYASDINTEIDDTYEAFRAGWLAGLDEVLKTIERIERNAGY